MTTVLTDAGRSATTLDQRIVSERRREAHSFTMARAMFSCWQARIPVLSDPSRRMVTWVGKGDLERLGVDGAPLTIGEIAALGADLRQGLSRRYEGIRTTKERQLETVLARCTGLRPLMSHWVGPFNVDFFFPQLGGLGRPGQPPSRGLVLEVDGEIHDSEPKMAKDEYKADALRSVGIWYTVVPNAKVHDPRVAETLQGLARCLRLDTRARRRVRAWVDLLTLFAHLDEPAIDALFGAPAGTTARLLELHRLRSSSARSARRRKVTE